VRTAKRVSCFWAACTVLGVLIATSVVAPRASAGFFFQDTTLDVPSPAECTVEPRPVPSPPATIEAAPSPSPTPTIPTGQPADAETVEAITAVVRGSIACYNASDILRWLAYFSNDYLSQKFFGPDGVDYEGFLQILSTPVAALREDQQLAVIHINDVQVLEDGSVSARVVTGDPADPFVDILIFVEQDGQWQIAMSIPVTTVDATPSP
jgi:hypothetical protein